MKTVAIIAEYNPFHTGHEYQIKKIREEFGENTRIVAIMSGNFTQRGDFAIIDKAQRAEAAVSCGVNLVLELPFPYSMSSAEFFAKNAVKIADSIGVVDYLSFGSESGYAESLVRVSDNILSDEYKSALLSEIKSEKDKKIGYPKLCEQVYRSLFPSEDDSVEFTPNNILAFEYIKALKEQKSNIIPHTIKRFGASYYENTITEYAHQSASAIRELMRRDFISALEYIPNNAKEVFLKSFKSNQSPCLDDRLSTAVITHLRLNPALSSENIHDAGGGLYNRLQKQSLIANDIHTLINLTDTKKYTTARIKRVIWYSFFGVTSSTVKESVSYTKVLAMDNVGKSILREIKKQTDFPVVTKPSSFDGLLATAKKQKMLADKADSIYQLTKPMPPHASYALTCSPYTAK